jgi:hypothetical protein
MKYGPRQPAFPGKVAAFKKAMRPMSGNETGLSSPPFRDLSFMGL